MYEEDHPLVLVVCDELERLRRARESLRAAGFLPASGRSIAAAVSLLAQVRVDACVVCQPISVEDAERLRGVLERFRPGCPKLCVREYVAADPPGWVVCAECDLTTATAAAFAV